MGRKFIVFGFGSAFPNGGMNDYRGDFNTGEEFEGIKDKIDKTFGEYQIYDTKNRIIHPYYSFEDFNAERIYLL